MADAPEEAKADKGARALECQQDNPKRDQSKSWRRYEAYKSATTVNEFLAKGGTPADLAHDVGKGFVWYLDEGPHINPVAKRERKPATEKPKKAQKVPLAQDDPWSAWNDDDLDDDEVDNEEEDDDSSHDQTYSSSEEDEQYRYSD